MTRTRRPNPVIIARYKGHCHDCGGDIHHGDRIVMIRYQRRSRPVHVDCHIARLARTQATKPAARVDTITVTTGKVDPAWEDRKAAQQAALREQRQRIADTARRHRELTRLVAKARKTG